ncbi:hypothetical protein M404DRAFT_993557 [Pisolithus tinctorius Marx 270]|uniref:Uncharacterized protein n=1 Tax=Pisolithus tinctorius Marx 270 TaxID=870435 RepID=A0A0C3PFA7_PISTI|nr:hypothetical protein M404DRAFT_993557 [Pisolithus tinctorius Marx 270]
MPPPEIQNLADRLLGGLPQISTPLPDVNCLPVQGNLRIEPFRRFVSITTFNYHSMSREPDQNENLEAARWQVPSAPHGPWTDTAGPPFQH